MSIFDVVKPSAATLNAKSVESLSNNPNKAKTFGGDNLTATELKARFASMARYLGECIVKFVDKTKNGLAAENIGAYNDTEYTETFTMTGNKTFELANKAGKISTITTEVAEETVEVEATLYSLSDTDSKTVVFIQNMTGDHTVTYFGYSNIQYLFNKLQATYASMKLLLDINEDTNESAIINAINAFETEIKEAFEYNEGTSNYDLLDALKAFEAEIKEAFNYNETTGIYELLDDFMTETEIGTKVTTDIATHNTADDTHPDIRNMAMGRQDGIVFDNQADLDAWLLSDTEYVVKKAEMYIGREIYLRDKDDPDYWVSSLPVTTLANLTELPIKTIDLTGYVPNTRTVNGKALSGDITLNADDIPYDETKTTKEAIDNKVATTTAILIGDGAGNAVDSGISASTILNTLTATTTTGNSVNIPNTNDGFIDKVKITNDTASAIESPLTGKSFGKNFAKIEDGTVTKYGITASALNGEITISGTGQAGKYLWVKYTNGLDIIDGTPSVVQPQSWIANVVLPNGTYQTTKKEISGSSTYVVNISYLKSDYSNNTISSGIISDCRAFVSYLGLAQTFTNYKFAIQTELGSTATTYEAYTETAFSIPLKDTDNATLSLAPASEIKLIDGKYHLDSTELHDDSQDALRAIATKQGQTNLIGNQPFTFDVTEFQLGLESVDAMLTLPNGTRVNVLTKDRLIYITSGDYAGKSLDYVLQESKNEIDGKAQDSEVIKNSGDQSIAGVLTFSSSPIVPNPTTEMQASPKQYVDTAVTILQTGYDLVIRTQAQFNTFVSACNGGTLTAKSVLIVGGGGGGASGEYTLSTTDNSGIKLPATLYNIHGINLAKIVITNFLYNPTTAKGGLWYDTLPTTLGYSIRDLEVDCTGMGIEVSGFYYCTNLTNCTGTGTGTGTGAYGYGFYGCTNLTNCTGTGSGTTAGYGFRGCTNLTNCKGTGTGGVGYGFISCTNLTNCTGTGTGTTDGYGFYIITYASICKDGGSSTAMWGGTNQNINLETCRKTPVEVTAGELTTLNT